MTEPILQVKDLSVYYNKKKALNSVSLDFAPKEITALIGPSGSGKSTLLKAINRMGDLNHEVTTTGIISTDRGPIRSNCVRKSEWSSNSPILSQCPFMIM